jgi:hypothetical protein
VLELNPSGWRCVCLVIANTHKAQEGPLVIWLLPTPSVKPQWVRYKLEKAIEMPCSDPLAIHQRKYIFGKMEIFLSPMVDEITTHGECVQPLQSVKLL